MTGGFTCNICGHRNRTFAPAEDRERPDCAKCESSVRLRSVVLQLSRALFGGDVALCDFPALKTLRGLGITDSEVYAGELAKRFSYTNTFYDKEPRLDLTAADVSAYGQFDFVICSEVMEHVEAPVERAFTALAKLLKPGGALIFSTPYSLEDPTAEHFAGVKGLALAVVDGRPVAVGRKADGAYAVFEDLKFHGGRGATVEMRLFAEAEVRERLAAAGFRSVTFDYAGSREFGVVYTIPCSLPAVARREEAPARAPHIVELVEEFATQSRVLRGVRESRWLKLGRALGVGPKIPD